jgi:hypothetical protein
MDRRALNKSLAYFYVEINTNESIDELRTKFNEELQLCLSDVNHKSMTDNNSDDELRQQHVKVLQGYLSSHSVSTNPLTIEPHKACGNTTIELSHLSPPGEQIEAPNAQQTQTSGMQPMDPVSKPLKEIIVTSTAASFMDNSRPGQVCALQDFDSQTVPRPKVSDPVERTALIVT